MLLREIQYTLTDRPVTMLSKSSRQTARLTSEKSNLQFTLKTKLCHGSFGET